MRKASGPETLLDLRGLRCPLPALRTQKALGGAVPGDVVVVLADDPLAGLDIPHLCRENGHELLSTEDRGDHRRFAIRKLAAPVNPS